MKIGVISDTHRGPGDEPLPGTLLDRFRGVELILHAGDLLVMEVLEQLETVAPVMAVAGNMDGPEVRRALPTKRIIDAEGQRIGLIHGWGPPWDLPQRVLREFPGEVSIVVFGHSHQPLRKWTEGRLLFNPGSPFSDRFSPGQSCGFLTLEGQQVSGEIVVW